MSKPHEEKTHEVMRIALFISIRKFTTSQKILTADNDNCKNTIGLTLVMCVYQTRKVWKTLLCFRMCLHYQKYANSKSSFTPSDSIGESERDLERMGL